MGKVPKEAVQTLSTRQEESHDKRENSQAFQYWLCLVSKTNLKERFVAWIVATLRAAISTSLSLSFSLYIHHIYIYILHTIPVPTDVSLKPQICK
mmetsp:Transcript_10683/g.25830  ORF Transcript_10683/g.25830 Transcript_10683/m.25830 type:complete len:95 (+) Transcript_10683:835-1119(+)